MTVPLFALERILERRLMFPFSIGLLALMGLSLVRLDWWLLGIGFVAWFLNGIVGQGLYRNRQKTVYELAHASADKYVKPEGRPTELDYALLSKGFLRFSAVVMITVAAVAVHLDAPWWVSVLSPVSAYVLCTLLGPAFPSSKQVVPQ
jgi:hypothetical protein